MMLVRSLRMLALAALIAVCPPLSAADGYTPKIGQAGKDVIWVPTPDALVERMLDMAKVTAQDHVVDLGSGDGRTVIAAARRGATALGIEYNADMVAVAKRSAETAGVTDRASFLQGDIFATDFSRATVVTMYLLSSLNLKLRPTLLAMRPGTRLVSHAFTMAEWEPDETATVEGAIAYLWIVPARVQGRWQATGPNGPFELTIEQTFQKLKAEARLQGRGVDVAQPLLSGAELSFSLPDASGAMVQFRGTVTGESVEGTTEDARGAKGRWSARRAK